jgi:hemerythrin-like metal-binding protein
VARVSAPHEEFLRGGAHLRLGLARIDRQHEEIRQLLNALYPACRNGCRRVWQPILGRLAAEVAKHFRTEERLMRRHGYDGLAAHRDRHRRLLERVAALAGEVEAGAKLDESALLYLKGWLRDHVTGPDALMAQSLRRSGAR